MRIDPLKALGGRLLEVEKPARYLGGELGSMRKEGEGLLTLALSFPDLYEIGMSNNAIRILYGALNRLPGVRCERVFAPAPDFEALLRDADLPLYTLESGIPLLEADILGFSVGYELAATSILAVLSAGRVPLLAAERGACDPIVIAGGPAISNPHPLADFLDAAWIGEAEAGFLALTEELALLKAAGEGREGLLERLSRESAVWMPGRGGAPSKRATRAIHAGFADEVYRSAAPLPTVKTVQDHGTVEIMRGCPNGCRFCHAGYYYRPQRAKPFSVIGEEVEHLVREGGHREITLASLSSGDYPNLPELMDWLGTRWSPSRVSFQLPSLKVNSFTLPLLSRLAEVRKSGLTFAVETPEDAWQRLVNKDVSFERTLAILEEARLAGFRQAKFYFMIGLPVPGRGVAEAEAIVEFFDRLFERIKMQINVNVGTFVPKPHTPFQWSAQLGEAESLEAINVLRAGLRRHRNLKLSYHSPFVSQLEGILSRGDERVGALILEAFKRGSRLDAWEEHFDRERWRSVIESAGWDVIAETCGERSTEAALAWDDISVRVTKATFREEWRKALDFELTDGCTEKCTHPCGSCTDDSRIVLKSEQAEVIFPDSPPVQSHYPSGRIVFTYRKFDNAPYFQHLSIIDAFNRAFLMADIKVAYSEGFNPMPRLETVQPLPIAVLSQAEVASITMSDYLEPQSFVTLMNERLPRGLEILEAMWFPCHPGVKQRSLGSLAWGSEFSIRGASPELLEKMRSVMEQVGLAKDNATLVQDGTIRVLLPDPKTKEAGLIRILEASMEERPVQAVLGLTRVRCLADAGDGPVSYFEAYEKVSARK